MENDEPDRAVANEFPEASKNDVLSRLRLEKPVVVPATVKNLQVWAVSQKELDQLTDDPSAVVPKSSVMPLPLDASKLPPTVIRSYLLTSELVLPKSSQTRLLPVPRLRSDEKLIWPGEFPALSVPFTVLAPPIVPDPLCSEPLETSTPPAKDPLTVSVPWLTEVLPV